MAAGDEVIATLGQVSPAAASLTPLYTVGANRSTVTSLLTCCNQSAAAVKVRLAVVPAGQAVAARHYSLYDLSLPVGATQELGWKLTLAAGDSVQVYAAAAGVSFGVWGQEVLSA